MAQPQTEDAEKVAQPAPASVDESKAANERQDAAASGTATANSTDAVEGASKPGKDTPEGSSENAPTLTGGDVSKETAVEEKKDENKTEDKPKGKAEEPASTSAAEEKKDENKSEDKAKGKAEEPATTSAAEENGDKAGEKAQPAYLANNKPLSELFDALPSILDKVGHKEMWGVSLKDSKDPPTVIVLMKYLRANEGDANAAGEQLTKSLEWRKKTDPLALAEATYPPGKFKGLGYITTHDDAKGSRVVFTWNVYGSVKEIKSTFEDVDEFIKWRAALMELAIRELKIGEATTVMDYTGEDPFQMIQVHDYMNVSFLRMDPAIRKASRETIERFSMAYPELLKEKYFVNVPAVMGWVFSAIKVLLSKNTIRKFHPLSSGASLASELDRFGGSIPKDYGGNGGSLAEQGRSPPLTAEASEPAQDKNSTPAEPKAAKDDGGPSKADEPSAPPTEPAESSEAAQGTTEASAPAAAEAPAKGTTTETPSTK